MDIKSRFLWADIIRIIAIYLVVATHLAPVPTTISIQNLFHYLFFAITRTCIPLFVMLSGALLLPKIETYKVFYQKRVVRLLLPWIFWSFVFLFVQKDYLPMVTGPISFVSAFIATMQSFWFLPMIAALYILTPALRIFVHNATTRDITFIVLVWAISIVILPYHHSSLGFPRQVDFGIVRLAISYVGYYLLGYLIVKSQLENKTICKFGLLAIALASVWTVIFVLNSSLNLEKTDYLFDYISPGVFLFSLGLFAVIWSLRTFIDRHIWVFGRQWISRVSLSALGIYFIHGFVMKHMTFRSDNALFDAFVIFSISAVIILLVGRVLFMRRLIS